jgi:very-short-patch-repair endonuclease
MKKNTDLARNLRKNQTPQEKKLWDLLRNHKFYGYEFRRQYPIGDYIVDFICREKKIIVELDGGQHNELENIERDKKRTDFLESIGYKVLRFWNNDVDNNIEGVFDIIKREFEKD